jgi:hypothetical protein
LKTITVFQKKSGVQRGTSPNTVGALSGNLSGENRNKLPFNKSNLPFNKWQD